MTFGLGKTRYIAVEGDTDSLGWPQGGEIGYLHHLTTAIAPINLVTGCLLVILSVNIVKINFLIDLLLKLVMRVQFPLHL